MKWPYSIILIVALLALSGCSQTSDSLMTPTKPQSQNITTSPVAKDKPSDEAVSIPKGNETVAVPSKKPVPNDSSKPTLSCEEKDTDDIPNKKDSQSKPVGGNINKAEVSETTPSENNTGFSSDEIEEAKLVAKEYYNGTVHKVESIEVVDRNTVDDYYPSEYEKGNIIAFSVKIKNSENPPRGIVLVRKDSSSNWKVLGEGY